jgi:hypothetical protein
LGQAQTQFDAAFGARENLNLRVLMQIATSTRLMIAVAEP